VLDCIHRNIESFPPLPGGSEHARGQDSCHEFAQRQVGDLAGKLSRAVPTVATGLWKLGELDAVAGPPARGGRGLDDIETAFPDIFSGAQPLTARYDR
jgi:hypothetical protein